MKKRLFELRVTTNWDYETESVLYVIATSIAEVFGFVHNDRAEGGVTRVTVNELNSTLGIVATDSAYATMGPVEISPKP